MDLYYLLRILGILVVVICCIIATYSDVKYLIIPNSLTFSMIIFGLLYVSFYFILIGHFNLFYYVSVVFIFILSYILWYFGLWAGGDVKLFVAISTLFIPEFLCVIPQYSLCGFIFPNFGVGFLVPTLVLIFNSIISVLPVILLTILYIIFKDKPYLKNELVNTFDIYTALLDLNIIIILNSIFNLISIDNILIKWLFIVVLMFIITKFINKNNKKTIITLTIITIIYKLYTASINQYIISWIMIETTITIINLTKNNLTSKIFTDTKKIEDIEESMILSHKLCIDQYDKYYFNTTLKEDIQKQKTIIENQARGLTNHEIILLKELIKQEKIENKIPIKRGIPFAPYILTALIITIIFGNMYEIIKIIIGVVI